MLVVNNPPDNAGDTGDAGSIAGLGRSPVGRNGSLHQYSCLENPVDREAWWAIVPWGRKKLDKTKRLHFHFHVILNKKFYV